ncbi:MAG: hypothetical protein PHV42_01120 [Candidatus Pacebacteria bacterium]|nr:hypothetical protein [Candidatus Paceibacterota bacterium]
MRTIIIILVIVGLLFLGYWYYGTPPSGSSALLVQTGAGAGDSGQMIGQKTIALLRELEKVQIDQSIFSTASFQSLQDFGVEIQPEPIGRPDPFAPVGFESGTMGLSTTTSTLGR